MNSKRAIVSAAATAILALGAGGTGIPDDKDGPNDD